MDFYAPKAKVVVEVDGPQHLDLDHSQNDSERDAYLTTSEGLRVLRFNNTQVLQELDVVVDAIFQVLIDRVDVNPSIPPF